MNSKITGSKCLTKPVLNWIITHQLKSWQIGKIAVSYFDNSNIIYRSLAAGHVGYEIKRLTWYGM